MRFLAWAAGLAAMVLAQAAWAGNVGFQAVSIPVAGDKPLQAGIWYPTDAPETPTTLGLFQQSVAQGAPPSAGRHPLVVMSHGTGGWYGEHYDTALALARAGFVVAAVSHTGDTYDDRSRVTRITERPAHLVRLTDFATADWSGHGAIDPARIGAFGFSAGGFTVLAAIGGEPDLALLPRHCVEHPHFFECQFTRLMKGAAPVRTPVAHDPRIRAAVIAAPALGYAFTPAGLSTVKMPVQLWRAEWDTVLPQPYYAEAVRAALPRAPDYRVVPRADHYDFLAPCTPALAKVAADICVPGFDRTGFHAKFNAEVVRFFRANLR
jgi:predicted dienelactone hydrolase